VAATRPTSALRTAALRTLFDFCGCVAATDEVEAGRWPLDRAGRLALRAHLRDQDDLHLDTVTHPGGIVWSAVCACALEREVSLADACAAAALGYELVVRLAEAAGPDHRRRWHVTTTAGTVGAAGAAATLLAPGAEADAVAHAASIAGGSVHAMVERAGTRFLHRAHAASSGVACARAAAEGISAAGHVLESGHGAFEELGAAAAAERSTAVRAATGLEETGFRLYPASGFAHAAVDAALSLAPVEAAAVDAVRVAVAPPAAVALASNPAPVDDEQAWWSIEHAVALALISADPDALAAGRTPAALELCRRVEVVEGGSGWSATVEVKLGSGDVRVAAVDGPPGHGDRPASDEDLLRKWERLTSRDGEPVLERLRAADDAEPLAPLLAFAGAG
jgi:2-methylcitrate dehydratase PrpD